MALHNPHLSIRSHPHSLPPSFHVNLHTIPSLASTNQPQSFFLLPPTPSPNFRSSKIPISLPQDENSAVAPHIFDERRDGIFSFEDDKAGSGKWRMGGDDYVILGVGGGEGERTLRNELFFWVDRKGEGGGTMIFFVLFWLGLGFGGRNKRGGGGEDERMVREKNSILSHFSQTNLVTREI